MHTSRELLERLVVCRPVSGEVGRVNAAVETLRSYLVERGVHTEVEELEGRRILYAATRPGREPRVLLNAHLDVVPAEEDVFSLRESGGWLYGRGTNDCLA